jgi:hypothetical protein
MGGAVDANDVGASRAKHVEGRSQRCPIGEPAGIVARQTADHWAMVQRVFHFDSNEDFLQDLERFEQDQLRTAIEQCADLVLEDALPDAGQRSTTKRANAARNENILPFGRGPRQLGRGPVQFADAPFVAERPEPYAICAETVGPDHSRAGSDGLLVNAEHEFWPADA